MTRCSSIILFSYILFSTLLFAEVNAQRPAGYVPVSQLKKAESEIDSLAMVVMNLQSQINSLNKIISNKDMTIAGLDTLVGKQKTEIQELSKELNEYRSHNLKLDQSNRILIVFNSIVGFLLLVTLIWFVRNLGKKKSAAKPASATVTGNTGSASGIRDVETKLEQLERLSRLREKGILTEEEFNFQKQQVLR
jgi:chromosome segregation ATPase